LVLLFAILAGVLAGLSIARWQKRAWASPPLCYLWLVLVAFLPQFLFFYLPATRTHIPDGWVSVGLLISQVLLLAFCWLNRHVVGVWLLALGLLLNFLVIAANGGFMPISPQTASRLVSAEAVQKIPPGSRFGHGKDILLATADTRLEWLSDRFLPPERFPYQVAFSLGDIVIAIGAFWLMAMPGKPPGLLPKVVLEEAK
jgi:hypothetical protein